MPQPSSDDIALLTLSAAYEVDLRLSGGPSDSKIFHSLADRLSEMSFGKESHKIAFLHSDPKNIEVLAKAFENSSSIEINDVDGLSQAVEGIIEPLRSTDHELNQLELTNIKEFCIALHRALAAADVIYNEEWEHTFNGEAAFY